jgi:hypothetical protein
MITDTQRKFLALLEPLFPKGANLRFLGGTEPDALGAELNRIRIDSAMDAINLRIPRTFVDDHRDGPASQQSELEERLAEFVTDKLRAFAPNPGPRLRPVIAWTFAQDEHAEPHLDAS